MSDALKEDTWHAKRAVSALRRLTSPVESWFCVNQGRIAEAKDGKYGTPDAAPAHSLPPKGPPGVKGRHLRASVQDALNKLKAEGYAGPTLASLEKAAQAYDKNEV